MFVTLELCCAGTPLAGLWSVASGFMARSVSARPVLARPPGPLWVGSNPGRSAAMPEYLG